LSGFKLFLIFCCIAIGIANILLFAFWWHTSDFSAVMPIEKNGYTVEALALNITLLEIILALVGFVLAALGLFGYTGIKGAAIDAAVKAAEQESKETIKEQMEKWQREQNFVSQGQTESSGDFEVGNTSVADAEPAENE